MLRIYCIEERTTEKESEGEMNIANLEKE